MKLEKFDSFPRWRAVITVRNVATVITSMEIIKFYQRSLIDTPRGTGHVHTYVRYIHTLDRVILEHECGVRGRMNNACRVPQTPLYCVSIKYS